ncbi:glycosyltransferase family 39 protein [Tortispora caseinolytica NRRL Y-17796]|uniref:Dolichyl-phosphate-mannose--protein mannosyltransferase n=1 Tax=Tortispora caseinolytica NRRL Y-17796 TaxID=767744 RepID=A0A1E4TM28_9ASCO|nr:glycosyltransferase family 39 protein [Tortispora caseinolytica NRRL Y-17796]
MKTAPIANPASPFQPSKGPAHKVVYTYRDKIAFVFVTLIALIVRLYKINFPPSVVFDEVHFGGFARKYILGRYFLDVHPPLAKMLFALIAKLGNLDEDFDFHEIGLSYLDKHVPYVAMRLYPGLLGVAVVSLAFLTLRNYNCSTLGATVGALLVCFENGLITQSRLILLDSPLIFGTAFTAWAWSSFETQNIFSFKWYLMLAVTGLGLGITASIKWVGLFTIAWIGVLTIYQLWRILGDLSVTPRTFVRHFSARVLFLILLPLSFYIGMFAIHFALLPIAADGAGFMSSRFQANMPGARNNEIPLKVALGSTITIRHVGTQGGYLHSHDHQYVGGSEQHQVTLYPHKDENNYWLVENGTIGADIDYATVPISYVTHGEVIRLKHVVTKRRLHSHDVRPSSDTDWLNEVSAYGYDGFEGDSNDLFRIEIVENTDPNTVVTAINSKIRLIHVGSGCQLFSRNYKLPDWGFGQQEVTCTNQGVFKNTVWYIEHNEHPLLDVYDEKVELVKYAPMSLLEKVIELNKVMWTTNAGLTASHPYMSRPSSWPILKRGINFWGHHKRHIYLLGNPLIWWTSTAAVAIYVVVKLFSVLRWQRSYDDYLKPSVQDYDHYLGSTFTAWALHYFPFFLMGRQLFLHHYLPALYFAILAIVLTIDIYAGAMPYNKFLRETIFVTFLLFSLVAFYRYSRITYGTEWTQSECNNAKILDTWDFNCALYPNSYEEYATVADPFAKPTITEATETEETEEAKVPEEEGEVSTEFIQVESEEEKKEPANEEEPTEEDLDSSIQTVYRTEADGQVKAYRKVYKDAKGNVIPPEKFAEIKNKVSVREPDPNF